MSLLAQTAGVRYTETAFISLLVGLACAAGGRVIMRSKGRSTRLGAVLGFFFGPIALIVLALVPVDQRTKDERDRRRAGMLARARTGGRSQNGPAGTVTRSRDRDPVDHDAARDEPILEPILEMVDVRAGYGSIEVLHGVSITVNRGEVLALLGPNGGGKSTSLKVCGGLLSATTGDIRLAGRSVGGVSADKLARLGLCTIPEGRGIFPNLSVRENLMMCTHTGAKLADIEAIAYDRFPRLGDRRSQLAGTMSGGEQQMLAMSRALSTDPAVLLLDELSMGLAPLIVGRLYEIVAQVAQDGVSVLVVEQFARTVLGIADRAAIMLSGRITRVGPPDELAEELSSAYLGGKGQS